MKPVTVELFFDFASPFSWLACSRALELEKMADVGLISVVFKPIRVMDVWAITNREAVNHHKPQQTAARSKHKDKYYIKDLNEWYQAYNLKPHQPSKQPQTSTKVQNSKELKLKMQNYGNACSGFLFLQNLSSCNREFELKYIRTILNEYWERGNRNIHEPKFILSVLESILEDPVDEVALNSFLSGPGKDAIIRWAKDAAERGSFGVPTFFINREFMYFGQDRFPLIQRRILLELGKIGNDDGGFTSWSKI